MISTIESIFYQQVLLTVFYFFLGGKNISKIKKNKIAKKASHIFLSFIWQHHLLLSCHSCLLVLFFNFLKSKSRINNKQVIFHLATSPSLVLSFLLACYFILACLFYFFNFLKSKQE